jgi:ATP-dependent Clp endopeptidase proteolytic subunit ClpP
MSNDTAEAMSPALEAATIAKLEAETAAARAGAAHTDAEARKAAAEATTAELAAAKAARLEAAALASDEHNHVYRFVGTVSGASVAACIKQLTEWTRTDPDCDVEIVFTSPGGSIIDGFVLFDFVRSLSHAGHKVTVGCLGMAASMAGILLQMGDHRWVGSEGWVMIHRAAFGASGKTFEVEDEVEFVKRIEKRIVAIFEARTGGKLTAARIKRNWDRKDWWIESEKALELGLVDEVR